MFSLKVLFGIFPYLPVHRNKVNFLNYSWIVDLNDFNFYEKWNNIVLLTPSKKHINSFSNVQHESTNLNLES